MARRETQWEKAGEWCCPKCGLPEANPWEPGKIIIRVNKVYTKDGKVWSQCLHCSGGYEFVAGIAGHSDTFTYDRDAHDEDKGWFWEDREGNYGY
jgi:hypothetical protein